MELLPSNERCVSIRILEIALGTLDRLTLYIPTVSYIRRVQLVSLVIRFLKAATRDVSAHDLELSAVKGMSMTAPRPWLQVAAGGPTAGIESLPVISA